MVARGAGARSRAAPCLVVRLALRHRPGRVRRYRWPVRVLERLEELYAIGDSRLGYSPAEDAAHELARGWLEDAGLEVRVDLAGNMFGGTDPVWTGSHLDTVPQ